MDDKIRKQLVYMPQFTNDNDVDEGDEEDDRCDLDPDKICDNCMMCLTGGADFRAISIDGIELESEYQAKHPEN